MSLLDIARGIRFVTYYFGGAPLTNPRYLREYKRGGVEAGRAVFRERSGRALRIAGAQLEVVGEENIPDGGCVLISDEGSLVDQCFCTMSSLSVATGKLPTRCSSRSLRGWLRRPPRNGWRRPPDQGRQRGPLQAGWLLGRDTDSCSSCVRGDGGRCGHDAHGVNRLRPGRLTVLFGRP